MNLSNIVFLCFSLFLTANGFNLPFIFNRIKPGNCPENDILLGKNPKKSICNTNECMHDYDCDGRQLCCPSDCNGRTCIDPAPRARQLRGPKTCVNLNALSKDSKFPCNQPGLRKCTSNYPGQCPSTHRCCIYTCGGVCIQV